MFGSESAALRTTVALPATRSKAIADELRRLIQAGELPPGSRLRQVEIATRFGVSTTPVREAFTALAREGLIQKDEMRGAVVFAPDLTDLQENYEIRGALEPLAAAMAAGQLASEQLDALDALVQRMQDATSHEYHELNRTLHATIYAGARRPRLASIIESLRDSSDAYFHMFADEQTYDPDYSAKVQREHEQIVSLLRQGNSRGAKKAVAAHLAHNYEHLTRGFAERPSA